MRKWAAVFIFALLGSPGVIAQSRSTWDLDPAHSNAQFVVRHLGISNVQGEFTKVSGTVQFDEQDISKSAVNATIEVNSVDTRNADRDADLKSEHFFDVAKYPTMTFVSRKITRGQDGKVKMTGDLTLHGTTRQVTFDVDGPTAAIQAMGGTRRGAAARTTINRQDFGMTYGGKLGTGDLLIGNDIAITLDIEMVKKS